MTNEETIFAEALARDSVQERAKYLDQACAGNADLRQQIDALLIAHQRAAGILESPAPILTAPHEEIGSTIGHYKLLEKIGEGGMGSVYMAEQTRPVRRLVALKIIKPGLDTREVIARFEAERQALAMMDHPGIAKVFDAGITETARSYFAMELVRGIPITEYCDQNQLSTRQRLELFVQVCGAVQHAHQKGIIHRDLKPTNVLVTVAEDKPVPKIIDFGIAKATDGQRLTERTLYTQFRELLGTPLYMSPEQAEMSAVMDVDTRSDVYSLGVLLYELLTGTTPFDKQRLAQAAYDEIRRIIREEDPPRPSTRLSALGATLAAICAQRQTDPRKLTQTIRGELDWIVMRALEKDRARRYETAIGLAKDVERYLSDQPVEACPPSRVYRLRKFARRNRGALTTGTVIAVVLMAATIVSTWQAIRATAEKRRADEQTAIAKAVSDFFNQDVLGQASTENQAPGTPNADLKVRDALDQAERGISTRFQSQPLVEAAIRHAIGQTYRKLGRYETAEQQLQIALQIRRDASGDASIDTLRTKAALGLLYGLGGEFERAEPLMLQALEGLRQMLGSRDRETLSTMNDLALLYVEQGKYAQAELLSQEALSGMREVCGPDDDDTAAALHGLAAVFQHQGEYSKAEALYLESLERSRRVYGSRHPKACASLNNLALMYQEQGLYEKALPIAIEAVEIARESLGEQHPDTFGVMGNLGSVYMTMGRYSEAEPLLLESLEGQRKVLGNSHPDTLYALNQLSLLYRRQREYEKAEPVAREAWEGARQVLGEAHSRTLIMQGNLAAVYFEQDKYDKAEPLLAEVYRLTPQSQAGPKQAAHFMERYARCLIRLHRDADAERPLRDAHDLLISAGMQSDPLLRDIVVGLIYVCDATNRPDEAAKWRAELTAMGPTSQPIAPATTPPTSKPQ